MVQEMAITSPMPAFQRLITAKIVMLIHSGRRQSGGGLKPGMGKFENVLGTDTVV